MAGKPSLKSELEEEILEAVCFYEKFQEDVDAIMADSSFANATRAHGSGKTRKVFNSWPVEVMGHLLSALQSYSARAYEDVDRHVHAAIQRIHNQELQDLKSARPRVDAQIKLALIRQKAFHNQETLKKLLAKFQQQK